MRCTRLVLTLGFLLGLPSIANAAPSSCPDSFLGGQAPDLVNHALASKAQELCYSQFAALHSGVSRTPLYSAEHLTRDQVQAAQGRGRPNAFHAESRLPPSDRAELNDYRASGFDRGHMVPNADMSTDQAKEECFTLANMIPQDHNSNTGVWERIETAVRGMAIVPLGVVSEGA